MDASTIVAIVSVSLTTFGGFILFPMRKDIQNLEDSVKSVQKELANHKLHTAENYVTKGEMSQHMDRIEKSLDEIKDLVKGK